MSEIMKFCMLPRARSYTHHTVPVLGAAVEAEAPTLEATHSICLPF
jgi:hypothetical protein